MRVASPFRDFLASALVFVTFSRLAQLASLVFLEKVASRSEELESHTQSGTSSVRLVVEDEALRRRPAFSQIAP